MQRPDYSGMLDEILTLDEGLTDWEIEFVEDMAIARKRYGRNWRLSGPQTAVMDRIYSDRVR